MKIHENQVKSLTKYSIKDGKIVDVKPSDHNLLELKLNSSWNPDKGEQIERKEVYNFNDKTCFQNFKFETDTNIDLQTCFNDTSENVNTACERWFKIFNTIIKRCFKKIRIKCQPKNKKEKTDLFEEKDNLVNEIAIVEDVDDDEVDFEI